MDEIHFTKIRDEEEISKRRRNLDGLMTLLERRNPNVKVLGLSATPVVNNLREGKSLLELITGKIYDDVSQNQLFLMQLLCMKNYLQSPFGSCQIIYVDIDTQF